MTFDPVQAAISLIVSAQLAEARDRTVTTTTTTAAAPAPAPAPKHIVTFVAAQEFLRACREASLRLDPVMGEKVAIIELMGCAYAPHGTCLDAARAIALVAIKRHNNNWGPAPSVIKPTIVVYPASKTEIDRLARERRTDRVDWRLPFQNNAEQVARLLKGESLI